MARRLQKRGMNSNGGGDIENMLQQMQGIWERNKNGPTMPPDGEYTMRLVSAEIRKNRAGDKLICFRQHTIVEGEYEGTTVHDMVSLGETQMRWFNQWINQMGYESPDQLSDAPEILEAIVAENPTYTAYLKQSGDFINITDFELANPVERDENSKDDALFKETDEDDSEDEETDEETDEDPDDVNEEEDEDDSEDEDVESDEEDDEENAFEDEDHEILMQIAAVCAMEVTDDMTKDELLEEMRQYDIDYNDIKSDKSFLPVARKYKLDVINIPKDAKKSAEKKSTAPVKSGKDSKGLPPPKKIGAAPAKGGKKKMVLKKK